MISAGILAAAAMAAAGTYGIISRRNPVFVVLSVELLFNAAILLFVIFMPLIGFSAGVVSTALILLAAGAAEVAVGLAIAIAISRKTRSGDILTMTELGGRN